MKDGPDIARLGSLIGDPARANMLVALLGGKALTASELAAEAGVGAPTASSHLTKLEQAKLISVRRSGRHRYHALAGPEVAGMLEALMGFTGQAIGTRTGPREPAMRKARICYDHLAGDMGVRMFDSLSAQGYLAGDVDTLALTDRGRKFFADLGIAIAVPKGSRRPLCKACLDWSARRSHLAGYLGQALLDHMIGTGWARREDASRVVTFTAKGEKAFADTFPMT